MIDNIPDLIAEARKWATNPDDYVEDDLLVRLSDALEAEHIALEEVTAAWMDKERQIAKVEAERDSYRATIRDALKVNMFKVGMHSYGEEYQAKVQRILTQALKGES